MATDIKMCVNPVCYISHEHVSHTTPSEERSDGKGDWKKISLTPKAPRCPQLRFIPYISVEIPARASNRITVLIKWEPWLSCNRIVHRISNHVPRRVTSSKGAGWHTTTRPMGRGSEWQQWRDVFLMHNRIESNCRARFDVVFAPL